jgi:hypothetical protein
MVACSAQSTERASYCLTELGVLRSGQISRLLHKALALGLSLSTDP